MSSKKNIAVVGSGIASLSCAALLAKAGHSVTVIEKNQEIGGRARQFTTENGFTFDMGPSWYWMPDVFERYYQQFGYATEDFYTLIRLDPSYRVFWGNKELDDIPAGKFELLKYFESQEPGSSPSLQQFLKDAAFKYQVGMRELVYKPGLSILEFIDIRVFKGIFRMNLLTPYSKFVRKYFKHPKLLTLLEFPILFLGATPKNTPALYSLMNYADMELGTWYPMGGMHEIIKAFERICREQGVKFETNCEVLGYLVEGKEVTAVETNTGEIPCDFVVSGADYQHTDALLAKHANYSLNYWNTRTLAPSALIFYVGVNKKIAGLQHHNLFFDADFETHAKDIYEDPQWPEHPLFYVCCPSKTDTSVAPEGSENLFLLIPIAPDLKDETETQECYFQLLLSRIKEHTGVDIAESITFKRSFSVSDFKEAYHSFKGNAYGLANTLKQTAVFKPKMKNKYLNNFYYTGQLTVPGPGLPPAIISGEIVAKEILKTLK